LDVIPQERLARCWRATTILRNVHRNFLVCGMAVNSQRGLAQ
jgi:hypothetical protein